MAQEGFVFKKGGSWFLRYRDDVIEDGQIVRKQQCKRLAAVCDQYRTEKDLHGLRDELLGPIGKVRPESTLTVAEFGEKCWLPWVRENCKPSTVAGYETVWRIYLAPYLQKITLRDFRTVDAANRFTEILRQHKIGRTTLQLCKRRLSGLFTLARNQGALDSPNPIEGAMIPKKAAASACLRSSLHPSDLSRLVEFRDCGRQNVIGQMLDELMVGIEALLTRWAAWHNNAAATLRFIRERPLNHGAEFQPVTRGAMPACPFESSQGL